MNEVRPIACEVGVLPRVHGSALFTRGETQSLGVTTLSLMPVMEWLDEAPLAERGLRNYWGYNTIGFLAPHNAYAAGSQGQQVTEFKTMVKALHEAGIEVILDVVYNHTAEGNEMGPTLCFRGLDNASYYRLVDDHIRELVLGAATHVTEREGPAA